jgi:hypothetical protein
VPTDLGPGAYYAAGIIITGDETLEHGGGWDGFRTGFEIHPDRHTAVAVACNSTAHNPSEMAKDLRDIWA